MLQADQVLTNIASATLKEDQRFGFKTAGGQWT
jgi:hypothetical protein